MLAMMSATERRVKMLNMRETMHEKQNLHSSSAPLADASPKYQTP